MFQGTSCLRTALVTLVKDCFPKRLLSSEKCLKLTFSKSFPSLPYFILWLQIYLIVGSHLSENLCALNTLAIFIYSAICLTIYIFSTIWPRKRPRSPEHRKISPWLSEWRTENTAAVLRPDLMRFRKRVGKDAVPSLPWKQDGLQSRCQQHRHQDESADDSSSGGGTDQATVAPVCTSSSLLRTKSRTETQTPPRPHWEHTVLPYKLCESKRTETWSISQLLQEMWRVPLFFQILMNWWSVVLFEKKQITHDSPLHLPSFNVGLFDFIQSHTHLGGNFLF